MTINLLTTSCKKRNDQVLPMIGKIIIICVVVLFLVSYFHFTQIGALFDKTVQIRDKIQNVTDPIIKTTLQDVAQNDLTKH